MEKIETTTIIHSTPQKVWQTLMDFDQYEQWNPFIKSIDGVASTGETLKVVIQPDGMKAQVFRPEVIQIKVNKEFRWVGHLFVKGLFDGEHYFLIQPTGDGSVTLIHGEIFRGLLARVILKMIRKSTRSGFEAMNNALKLKAETNQTV